MKVLLTGGGTREPIDGVRFITNFSTGATAARLADFFSSRGDSVTYLHAEGAVLPKFPCRLKKFVTFADLNDALAGQLGTEDFDLVIHLAAVSDYSVHAIEVGGRTIAPGPGGKLPSREEVVLRLRPNFKIIDRIRSYARNPRMTLVGFKLTNTPVEAERQERIRALSANPEIDYVVHNDLGERQAGRNHFTIYRQNQAQARCDSIESLAGTLVQLIGEKK